MTLSDEEIRKIANATCGLNDANVREVLAALAAAGYATVPVEPTEAMKDAAYMHTRGDSAAGARETAARIYRAMLAATRHDR